MSANSNKVEELFIAALQIPSSTERERWLSETCSSDSGLRVQVEQMLVAYARAEKDGSLNEPVQYAVESKIGKDEGKSEDDGATLPPRRPGPSHAAPTAEQLPR